MVSAARTWALFKLIRILIFSISTIASMGWTTLYTVLVIRGWTSFTVDQRIIVLIMLSIYGISSIILYLMIVVRFRLWMDGARVAFLILFQAGGTVAFFLFRPSFPCHNIGPPTTCKIIEDIVIFGGWSLSCLLLIYAFFLAIMHYVPVPQPPPNPEAALAVDLHNQISLEKEKRHSTISVYSQSSFTGLATPGSIDRNRVAPIASPVRTGPNYYRTVTPTSVRSMVPSVHYPTDGSQAPSISSRAPSMSSRAPSIASRAPSVASRAPSTASRAPSTASRGRMAYNYYRPGTPGSIQNYYSRPGTPGSILSTTSRSSNQGLINPRYNYIYPSRTTTPASSIRSALSASARPPNEPISRQGTPLSVVSYQDSIVNGGPYDQRYPRTLTPSGLTPGVRSRNMPQPMTSSQSLTYGPNAAAPPLAQPPFSATISLRSAPPGIRPPRSEGSERMSTRSGTVSSVPRSPSPQNLSFNAPIPSTPMSAVLPAHPGLPKSPYHGRRGVHEVRRYGSVPDIRVNDALTYANSHYRAVSDQHGEPINRFAVRGGNEQHANIQQWRDLMYNASR